MEAPERLPIRFLPRESNPFMIERYAQPTLERVSCLVPVFDLVRVERRLYLIG